MFIVKNCWGTPVPGGVCATKPWSFSSACKNLSQQRPLVAKIWSFEKVDFGGSESAHSTVLLVTTVHQPFFVERGRNRSRSRVFPVFDIFIPSEDICERSLKWSEIDPNFALLWPATFLGGGPPNFGT